jgi:transcriptional regulator with XRE-family HTH domain
MMKKIDLGAAGWNVARNVKGYRRERKLSYAELSRRLDECGRRIPPLGLRQLEKGERRVDIDDLFTLAEALNVEPWVLYMSDRWRGPSRSFGSTGLHTLLNHRDKTVTK